VETLIILLVAAAAWLARAALLDRETITGDQVRAVAQAASPAQKRINTTRS
jgi:hypothetical protein